MGLEGAETAEKGLEGGTSDLFEGASGIDRHQAGAYHRCQAPENRTVLAAGLESAGERARHFQHYVRS